MCAYCDSPDLQVLVWWDVGKQTLVDYAVPTEYYCSVCDSTVETREIPVHHSGVGEIDE